MNVNPGELNKKITIFEYTETQDEDGYPVKEKNLVHSANASFKRMSGAETVKANADFTTEKVRFLIRYTSKELDRRMLVEYNKKEYEIEYINDYEDAHEYIEIWATRIEVE